jgi:transposase
MKRDFSWVGYKVHLTETCEETTLHVITHVETTAAPTPDEMMLAPIHAALHARNLVPAEHRVDNGYMDTPRLRAAREEYGMRLVGPVTEDHSWQAQAGAGYAAARFALDWEARHVTCPAGQRSKRWVANDNGTGQERVQVRFPTKICRACAGRAHCTTSARQGRVLTLRPQAEYVALQTQRTQQQTAEFKAEYAARAGVEGTLGQGLRLGDLRQARYIGAAKTRLQHIVIAVALNLLRLVAWWQERPRAQTRISAFALLASTRPYGASAATG